MFAVQVIMPRNPMEVAIHLGLMPKGSRSSTNSCRTILMPHLMSSADAMPNAVRSCPVDQVCIAPWLC